METPLLDVLRGRGNLRLWTGLCLIRLSSLSAPIRGAQGVSLRVWDLIWLWPGWPPRGGWIRWAGPARWSLLWRLKLWNAARGSACVHEGMSCPFTKASLEHPVAAIEGKSMLEQFSWDTVPQQQVERSRSLQPYLVCGLRNRRATPSYGAHCDILCYLCPAITGQWLLLKMISLQGRPAACQPQQEP